MITVPLTKLKDIRLNKRGKVYVLNIDDGIYVANTLTEVHAIISAAINPVRKLQVTHL